MTEGAIGAAPGVMTRANDFIAEELRRQLGELEATHGAHFLCMNGPLYTGADDLVRHLIEDRSDKDSEQTSLFVLLTSNGGQVEPVQRIVEVIRHHYETVSFIVPNYAYSAGTILAMSGDNILMDYYGRLGPIDPQVRSTNGQMLPALGYLQRWNQLLARAEAGKITTAEVQVMLSFDQAELYMYEQAKEQSVELLVEWLAQYKFKSWDETTTQRLKVTPEMRRTRAEEVALILSDSDKWHSHGRGISKEVLERDVGLIIDDLSANPDLYSRVKAYDHLLRDFMDVRSAIAAFHVSTSAPVLI